LLQEEIFREDDIMSDSAVSTTQLSLVSRPTSTATTNAVNQRQEVSQSGKVSPQQAEPQIDAEDVAKAVSEISDYVQNISRDLQFQVDKQTGSTIVTVLDHETKEVIRQIPTEEVVAMARFIAENAPDPVKGLLMNGEG
jgi:flagellar protein FlaG